MRYLPSTALCLAAMLLCGCNFLQRNTIGLIKSDYPSEKASLRHRKDAGRVQKVDKTGDVELLWQIPREPVDGFVIKYSVGDGAGTEKQVRVPAADLAKFEDESYGFVYRYILKEIPAQSSVLVAISAYRGDQISSPSQVVRIDPEVVQK